MINDENFNSWKIYRSETASEFTLTSISNDGHLIKIKVEMELQDMPVGTYTFTTDDQLNIVTIGKYIGSDKASGYQEVLADEWMIFKCEGQLIIEDQMNGVTTGAI